LNNLWNNVLSPNNPSEA
jgi:hypothetical protein